MFTMISKNSIRVSNLIFTIEDGEDYSTLGHLFGDGNIETMFMYTEDIYAFIGICFHSMQQCGGRLVDTLGEEIKATCMEQTSGSALSPTEIVEYGTIRRKLLDIIHG